MKEHTTDQSVQLDYPKVDGLAVARVGTPEQPVLARKGDDVRIDWGYGYLAAPTGAGTIVAGGPGGRLRNGFATAVTTGHGEKFVPALSDIVAELNGVSLVEPPKT